MHAAVVCETIQFSPLSSIITRAQYGIEQVITEK